MKKLVFLPGRLGRRARLWVARVLVPGPWLAWWQRWAQRAWPLARPGPPAPDGCVRAGARPPQSPPPKPPPPKPLGRRSLPWTVRWRPAASRPASHEPEN